MLLQWRVSRRVQACPFCRYYRLTGDVGLVPWTSVTGTAGYIAPEILQVRATLLVGGFRLPESYATAGAGVFKQMISSRRCVRTTCLPPHWKPPRSAATTRRQSTSGPSASSSTSALPGSRPSTPTHRCVRRLGVGMEVGKEAQPARTSSWPAQCLTGPPDFPARPWASISGEAQDLCRGLLQVWVGVWLCSLP